jgi:hypothetical protein
MNHFNGASGLDNTFGGKIRNRFCGCNAQNRPKAFSRSHKGVFHGPAQTGLEAGAVQQLRKASVYNALFLV